MPIAAGSMRQWRKVGTSFESKRSRRKCTSATVDCRRCLLKRGAEEGDYAAAHEVLAGSGILDVHGDESPARPMLAEVAAGRVAEAWEKTISG